VVCEHVIAVPHEKHARSSTSGGASATSGLSSPTSGRGRGGLSTSTAGRGGVLANTAGVRYILMPRLSEF